VSRTALDSRPSTSEIQCLRLIYNDGLGLEHPTVFLPGSSLAGSSSCGNAGRARSWENYLDRFTTLGLATECLPDITRAEPLLIKVAVSPALPTQLYPSP